MTDEESPADRSEAGDGPDVGAAGSEAGTAGPDDLEVPAAPPDPETAAHVLPPEDMVYPTLSFESGTVGPDGFDCRRELDAEPMADWLEALAGALVSHDLAVEGADRRAYLGIAPSAVDLAFDPDEDHRGTIELTVSLDARVMRYEDADARPTGARGGRGFVPFAMLTGDRDPDAFRCYNWIEDPTAGLRGSSAEAEAASSDGRDDQESTGPPST